MSIEGDINETKMAMASVILAGMLSGQRVNVDGKHAVEIYPVKAMRMAEALFNLYMGKEEKTGKSKVD